MSCSVRYTRPAIVLLVYVLAMPTCFSESLYKRAPGPYQVNIAEAVTVNDPERGQDMTFRVSYPDSDEIFPVVVFSTGGFCPSQMYDLIAHHWVSHGYVLVAPDHVDSPNRSEPPTPEQMQTIVQRRLRDVSFAVDALEDIRREADIEARMDATKLAVAGHSFGSGVAMMKAGMFVTDREQGPWGPTHDDRFRAAILLSPAGRTEQMAPNAFDGLTGPFIATGGTKDVGRVDPGELTPTEWRRQAFLLAPPGDKYSLIVDGADHYMGGLICNPERGGAPDYDAVEIVRSVTTAFLEAYLSDTETAKDYLLTADIRSQSGGRADFRHR